MLHLFKYSQPAWVINDKNKRKTWKMFKSNILISFSYVQFNQKLCNSKPNKTWSVIKNDIFGKDSVVQNLCSSYRDSNWDNLLTGQVSVESACQKSDIYERAVRGNLKMLKKAIKSPVKHTHHGHSKGGIKCCFQMRPQLILLAYMVFVKENHHMLVGKLCFGDASARTLIHIFLVLTGRWMELKTGQTC